MEMSQLSVRIIGENKIELKYSLNPHKFERDLADSSINISCSSHQARKLVWLCGCVRLLPSFVMALCADHGFEFVNVLIIHIAAKTPLTEDIDYAWEWRLALLIEYSLEVERNFWVLSTYGGALSALGDYDRTFAKKAGEISRRQLCIARILGDPVLIARCNLFCCLSLAQRGIIFRSLKLLKDQYEAALVLDNDFLYRCCEGTYSKISSIYLKFMRKRKKRMNDANQNNIDQT